MSWKSVTGSVSVPVYWATPEQFGEVVKELSALMDERLDDALQELIGEDEGALAKLLSEPDSLDPVAYRARVDSLLEVISYQRNSFGDPGMVSVRYQLRGMEVIERLNVDDIPALDFFGARGGFTIYMSPDRVRESITVTKPGGGSLTVAINGQSVDWVEQVRKTAELHMSPNRPGWWWIRNLALSWLFAPGLLIAALVLLTVAPDVPSWIPIILLLLTLVFSSLSLIPRVLIRPKSGSLRQRLTPFFMWILGIVLSSAAAYFLGKFFG